MRSVFCLCLMFSLIACENRNSQPVTVEIDQLPGPNPWTNLDWNNQSENFQFVIVTDRTGGNRPGVFEQGMEKVNLLQPEFVMSVGDLIQGYTEDLGELNRQWNEFDQLVDQLEMPFFYVPGNHDITNKVMEDLWFERYGRTYYHFAYKNVLFLCLNSEEPVFEEDHPEGVYHTGDFYLSTPQRKYIEKTLAEYPEVRWTFLFWHKPVWLHEESDNPVVQNALAQSGWAEVESLLKDRRHTVFAGHIHRYEYRQRNKSDYITLATTGGGSALGGPVFGQFDHVLWVTMTDDGPVMANLLLNGIFDKDFTSEDIEKNLELTLRHQVMRVDTRFEDLTNMARHNLKFTLFNQLDEPVSITVRFTDSENINFDKSSLQDSIPPNSASTYQVAVKSLALPNAGEPGYQTALEELEREFKAKYAHWEMVYEFERYGKITVTGSNQLYP